MTLSTALRTYLLRWEVIVGTAVIGFIGLYAVRFFLYEPFRIPSESMHPTLPKGSVVIVRKRGFGNYGSGGFTPIHMEGTAPILRGDIIVFGLPQNRATNYIMRVVGLPGDHVVYAAHRLRINGVDVPVQLGAADARYQYATEALEGRDISLAFMPERPSPETDVRVPPDHVFVLGDSRDNARDSRFIGFVPRSHVIGVYVTTLGTVGT